MGALVLVMMMTLNGCAAHHPEYEPLPPRRDPVRTPAATAPLHRPPSVPEARVPEPGDALSRLPQDDEGFGRGPLGRTSVMLDRAIGSVEVRQQRGESVDPALLAHLRMVRQSRDLIATGDTERAADLLERAIAIGDGAGFAYLYLGYLHSLAGRQEQGVVFLDRASALLPQDPVLRQELSSLRASIHSGVIPAAQVR
jgi:hypothetical protein